MPIRCSAGRRSVRQGLSINYYIIENQIFASGYLEGFGCGIVHLSLKILQHDAADFVSGIADEPQGLSAPDGEIPEFDAIHAPGHDIRFADDLDRASVEGAAVAVEDDVSQVHVSFISGLEIPFREIGEDAVVSGRFDACEEGVTDGVVRRASQPDRLAAGIQPAVFHADVFADDLLLRIFPNRAQNDAIVTGLDIGVPYPYMGATVEIDPVVVDHPLVGDDPDPVNLNVPAEPDQHRPAGRILEGNPGQADALAADELNHPRSGDRRFGIIIAWAASIEKGRTLSIDGAFSGNGNVLGVIGIEKDFVGTFGPDPAHFFRKADVILAPGAAQQDGVFLQVQFDVALQLEGVDRVCPRRDDDDPAAPSGGFVDGFLDGFTGRLFDPVGARGAGGQEQGASDQQAGRNRDSLHGSRF